MRFNRISIQYVGDDGTTVKERNFTSYKEAQDRADKLHRAVLFKKSEVEVIGKADMFSPKWATHIAFNSDNRRYDLRIENDKLIRIKIAENKF